MIKLVSATPDDSAMDDREWFARNFETNFRTRDPRPGELAEIQGAMLSRGASHGPEDIRPAGGRSWKILAIKMPGDHIARMPVMGEAEPAEGLPHLRFIALAVGGRIAID